MRPILLVAIIGVLLLASCNSAPEPTATPIPPTATEAATATPVANPADNIGDFEGTLTVPIPGTLAVGSTGGTPMRPRSLVLNQVTFTQTGGAANVNYVIRLQGDGTLTVDGVTSTVSPDQVQQIVALLDQINFYNIQGTFVSGDSAADTYRYALNVDSSIGSRTIFSQDGLTPPETSASLRCAARFGRQLGLRALAPLQAKGDQPAQVGQDVLDQARRVLRFTPHLNRVHPGGGRVEQRRDFVVEHKAVTRRRTRVCGGKPVALDVFLEALGGIRTPDRQLEVLDHRRKHRAELIRRRLADHAEQQTGCIQFGEHLWNFRVEHVAARSR